MELNKLKKKIEPQWRVQSFSKNKAMCSCVAYIDARDVMDILDDAVGAGNWQDKYELVDDKLYCYIGILIDGQWVWKGDCGTETNTEKEKGQSSDAFKRAAVKWGIGRFIYSLPIQYLKANEVKNDKNNPYPIDDSGKRIYDLTKFINEILNK